MIKTVKFGGTSLSSADQFKKVKEIINSDPSRKFVIVSAPGARFDNDVKITDLLILLKETYDLGQDISSIAESIIKRYQNIANDLKIEMNFTTLMEEIIQDLELGANDSYILSRGEYLSAQLMSKFIGFPFIDATEIIFFDDRGHYDREKTYKLGKERLSNVSCAVIPGFYGARPTGEIEVFSRGGSDLTGSIVARNTKSDLYENFTDVDGFLVTDPRIIKNPRIIQQITYNELRELSYMGAAVLHDEAMFPVMKDAIPIDVKNTNHPNNPGTRILKERSNSNNTVITGIAGRTNFTVLDLNKLLMNKEKLFFSRLMQIIESYGLYIEHMPSSIDTLSVIIEDDEKKPKILDIIADIKKILQPDHVSYSTNIALISIVGDGMQKMTGTASKIFTALSDENINVRLIVQGSSERNIIIGVNDEDYKKSIRAIYYAFFEENN